MTIEEMKKRKRELGYTTEQLAERSGVPVSTVRKIFSGATKNPRRKTILALEAILKKQQGEYTKEDVEAMRPGRYVELINGTLYATTTGEPLSEEDIEALRMKESSAPYLTDSVVGLGARGNERKTRADYDAMPDGWRGELIDGVIYDLAAPSIAHQTAVIEIANQLKNFADREQHDCGVYVGPIAVRLSEDMDETVEPDIVVLCDSGKLTKQEITGAPDMVVEVLSPSTRSRDLLLKLNLYMRSGVKEYWVVDTEEQYVLIYDFQHDIIGVRHDFETPIKVGISDGKLSIDCCALRQSLTRE